MSTITPPPVTRSRRRALQPFTGVSVPNWRESALCREGIGIDFFPFSEDAQAIHRVKAICERCPVTDDCLAYAMETRQGEGVWGGLTSTERIYLRRKWTEHNRAIAEMNANAAAAKKDTRLKEKTSS